jgi:hypothetical protein
MARNSSTKRSAAVALALALCCCAAAVASADGGDGASRSRPAAAVTVSRGAVHEASRAAYKKCEHVNVFEQDFDLAGKATINVSSSPLVFLTRISV